MSYEYHERRQPCPCGNGFVVSSWEDNDWGQTRDEENKMECPVCVHLYEFKVIGIRSDDHSPRMAWVRKSERGKPN